MKPLQVLILITKSYWGGAQRYVFDVATRLPKDRYSVEVMTGDEGPLTEKLRAAGIPATSNLEVGRDVSFFADVRAAFGLFRILRTKKPDVLHVNSSKIGGIGAFAGRLAGVKRIVFTAHGWAFNEDRPFIQKPFIKSLYWLTMMLSHETITVSEAARKQVRNWPYIQGKIVVIHNGIAKETGFARANARVELARRSPALKAALDSVSESNIIWIGTIAELHPVKGHSYAIQAIRKCADSLKQNGSPKKIIYTIIGDGQDKARLEDEIEAAGLGKQVFLLGHVDRASEYVKAFDIFLLASLSEALGMVLLEAGASSVPVVATTVGGIPEIVSDMQSGVLVQPRHSGELAHALLYMIEHPEERRAYGAALREKVLRDFSVDKMIEGVEVAYVSK